jgi:DNA-binding NarL/FixJ family response regulator
MSLVAFGVTLKGQWLKGSLSLKGKPLVSVLKVVLCASETLVRSVREIVPALNEIDLRLCAPDTSSLIEVCRDYLPHVIMLEKDGDMGVTMAIIHQLRAQPSRSDVIIIAHESNPLHARYLLNEGVKGYLLVSSLYEDFASSLRLVAAGKTVLSPLVAQALLTTKQ